MDSAWRPTILTTEHDSSSQVATMVAPAADGLHAGRVLLFGARGLVPIEASLSRGPR